MKQENTVISIQLPKNLLEKIKEKASSMSLSMTAYVRLVLMNDVNQEDN